MFKLVATLDTKNYNVRNMIDGIIRNAISELVDYDIKYIKDDSRGISIKEASDTAVAYKVYKEILEFDEIVSKEDQQAIEKKTLKKKKKNWRIGLLTIN